MNKFNASNGQTYAGQKLAGAMKAVADDRRRSAHAIRNGSYADHVTEDYKDKRLEADLAIADKLEAGEGWNCFASWQRLNEKLTGECVGFLPPPKSKEDCRQ